MILKNFEDFQVRIIDIDGEPWFIARDVCMVLKNTDTPKAVERLHESEKLIRTLLVSGQNRQVNLINESGLYHLIFTSRLPEAERFRLWVTSEVLPEIRKTGGYQLPTDPVEVALMAAEQLRAERDKRIQAEKNLSLAQPAIDFFESVAADGSETYSITDVAKMLGIPVKGFFGTLRRRKDLCLANKPSAEMVKKGVMCEKLITYKDRDDKERQKPTTRITGFGVTFYEKLKRLGRL